MRKVYEKFGENLHSLTRAIWYKKDIKTRYARLKLYSIPVKKLSREQKKQVKAIWGKSMKNDYSTHEIIYSISGVFDPYLCPNALFGTKLGFALNDSQKVIPWADKNYFDKFFPEVRFPHTLIHNISGVFYDRNYQKISMQEAINLLEGYDYVCIKPSLESGSGKGVQKIAVDDNIESTFKSYRQDFIVQEILEQYPPIKEINPSSVNIVRVNTLFINGRVSVLSASMRFGAVGKFNDNSPSPDGKGRIIVGVNDEGVLKDVAHYACGLSLNIAPSGAAFAGLKIPNYDRVKEIVTSIHSKLPFARFIGFDVAFDKEGQPVVMEYNINAPGTFYYQLANGPLFADRTQEVIDTMRKEKIIR